MKTLLVLLALCFSLSGCAWLVKKEPIITNKIVKLDPRSLERCEALTPIIDADKLLETSLLNMEIYANCARKQDNSIKLLKEFSNYKETTK